MARDTQKARAYRSESVLYSKAHLGHDETRAMIDRVMRSKWMGRHAPVVARRYRLGWLTVRCEARGHISRAGRTGITLRGRSIPAWLVLHEIAHVLSPEDPGHGHQWAAIYLRLVRRFLGVESYRRLRASFRSNRVRYTEPRRISDHQRAVLAERLARYREAQAAARLVAA